MISFNDNIFRINTAANSYWFRVTAYGHLEHIYYGGRLPDGQGIEALLHKRTAAIGSSVLYTPEDEFYCLDLLCLEWSGIGKGDYRHSPAEIRMPDGSYTADFVYQGHRVMDGCVAMAALPGAYDGGDSTGDSPAGCATLEVTLEDQSNRVSLILYYTVFYDTDVITRRTVLVNENPAPLLIRKLMSMSLDLPDDGYRLVTFDGSWIKEGQRHERRISPGIHVNSSTTGASSQRHNPGFLLAAAEAGEDSGSVYGFNLIYSGNHYGAVELSGHDLVRVQIGINPHCFEWTLTEGERFESPEAVLTHSVNGFNGLSRQFHDFINRHIVRGDWKGRERPILCNSWEAFFFRFTRGKLLGLARRAASVGVEMFVLDDGWFGKRDDDRAGLGDYNVNRRKLPGGLARFARRIGRMGLGFGLWFEPEMVNPDSDLYRAHPEWALATPGKTAALGRNQLVLDLTNPAVRDYIVENVTAILDSAPIGYVKWDFNRHISDGYSSRLAEQGHFFHMYILGLYEVLGRIFAPRPHILLESCASGGGRFDLGMLCFSPQVWTSDDTDPVERLKIQGGLSHLYPLSTMGAHVSEAPHQQTLRDTPLATRFNVAAFGCLGYELDFKYLSPVERREVREQIAFYKENRRLFQYGRFLRGETAKANKVVWQVVGAEGEDGKSQNADEARTAAIVGFFQTQATASEGFDRLPIKGLDPDQKYRVRTRPQSLFIRRFGGLVKHILPLTLDPNGFVLRLVNRFHRLVDCVEEYEAYGAALAGGVMLNNQFVGSHYNKNTRLLGDWGSNLYVIEANES